METLTAIGTGDDSEREQEPEDGNSGTGRTGTPGQDAVTTLTAVQIHDTVDSAIVKTIKPIDFL